jgi:glycosyltransferase involved in cell wall biosynthesis
VISVVIPAYNEEENLPRTLEALMGQDTDQMFEVVVVDNNSTDKTAVAARKFTHKLNLKVIVEKTKGRGAARRCGFAHAVGEIILSTDADTIMPKNWIARLVRELVSDTNAGAVTGTCKFGDQSPRVNMLLNVFQPVAMRMYRIVFGHYWLSGFNFGIYKEIYEKSGGFEQKLNAQEDINLSFKVAKIAKIKFLSDVPVIASGRRFEKGVVLGLISYISTFVSYFWLKNDRVYLEDRR